MSNQVIVDVCSVLSQLDKLQFILHVGIKRCPANRKVDLLAGLVGGDIEKYAPAIEATFRERWPSGNFFVLDDSVRFDLSAVSGGVAVCNSITIADQIMEWIQGKRLEGQCRSWAVGYWLPEALCGDIATAKILHDIDDIGTGLKRLVTPYPESLSQAIVELCTDEIRQKLYTLDESSQKDARVEMGLCLSNITASMIRLAFARSRKYLRGFRSLAKQAQFLSASDMVIYRLALELQKSDGAKAVIDEIRRQF